LPWAIDYYQIEVAINGLQTAGFDRMEILKTIKEGMYNPAWQDALGNEDVLRLQRPLTQVGVGASGCTMGLMAGYAMTFPEHKLMMIFLPIPIKAKFFIPLILAYEIISGISGGSSMFGVSVAHFAHVGGAITGLIIAWYWKKNSFNKNRWN